MKEPHLFNIGTNKKTLLRNLQNVLNADGIAAIDLEIKKNIFELHKLGKDHFKFAKLLQRKDWRQKISRYYYAALNIKRAITLFHNGKYFTDSTDHKNISDLPKNFPNLEQYKNQLPILRDDRNLSDYDHTAKQKDLAINLQEAENLVSGLILDSTKFFKENNLNINKRPI